MRINRVFMHTMLGRKDVVDLCAIAGVLGLTAPDQVAEKMLATMKRRGPDGRGVFRGGAICPGLSTGLRTLHEKTAQLPLVRPAAPGAAIGRDTEACILSGAVYGAAALIDGMAARFEEELGQPATLVVTGGHSRWAAPLCRHPLVRDEHLMMKGLALLWELNRAKKG